MWGICPTGLWVTNPCGASEILENPPGNVDPFRKLGLEHYGFHRLRGFEEMRSQKGLENSCDPQSFLPASGTKSQNAVALFLREKSVCFHHHPGYQAGALPSRIPLMKVLHVNRSQAKTLVINGEEVSTGIYKEAVAGPVRVHKLTLEGDVQIDRRYHGGEHQAVYVYPFEHYAHWEKELGVVSFPPGTFGENLTTEGLLETEICIGDILRAGEIVLQVTSVRLPCFKLGYKFGKPAILKPFLRSGFSGFYCSVLEEGMISAGTAVEIIERDPRRVSARDLLGMQRLGEGTRESLEKLLEIEALSPPAREDLLARLGKA